ncbi:SPRY domain-containing protein 7 [Macrosteles quadrilineatus]|uniref:SPRY domain-containing protein 7 n=1 Tax=Macrosteles quadrilineatus TaxID=74068 RepID=UPI0023E2BDD6|nr:SPRY domain-containing protein 7 [Macrosteles quadrilineatus]
MSLTMLCCFKSCFNGLGFPAQHIPRPEINNPIVLDTSHMGHEVVIIKNGLRICGSGGALCTAPLVQSKSYFEVKLQQSGVWGVGLATRNTDINAAPGGKDSESWVLCHDGVQRHNNTEVDRVTNNAVEGDILGVSFDHIELNFYVNGKPMEKPITGVRGTVYPALFVDEGAILDIIVDNFQHPPPSGFDRIMLEQSLL